MGTLKCIVFSAFIFTVGFVFSQEEAIPWSPELKLQWKNFKGRPFKRARASAVTASGLSYQFSSVENKGRFELDIKVGAYFYPEQSWYQPKLCDALILSHEQLHFDISELYARKMRKRLANAIFTKNVKTEIKAIYKSILKDLSNFQKKYDYETNFSRNVQQQLLWNKAIEKRLSDK
ncbi:MAG: DUF922 domain-containing protein [Flavobacteriaceae bacterium]